MEDQFENIVQALQEKAVVKQHIYRINKEVFQQLRTMGEETIQLLKKRFQDIDKTVPFDVIDQGEFEFQLLFGGDVLIFSMQTNVQVFGEEHILSKSPYVQEAPERGYYGTITVYNFLADSVRYNRLNDAGYLLARMMLNCDAHFYIEGIRALNFLHPDIAENKISVAILKKFIEISILLAAEQDLHAPPYQDVQFIPLGAKLADQMAGAAKVGFQMKVKDSDQNSPNP